MSEPLTIEKLIFEVKVAMDRLKARVQAIQTHSVDLVEAVLILEQAQNMVLSQISAQLKNLMLEVERLKAVQTLEAK